jgi:hypothetical protein
VVSTKNGTQNGSCSLSKVRRSSWDKGSRVLLKGFGRIPPFQQHLQLLMSDVSLYGLTAVVVFVGLACVSFLGTVAFLILSRSKKNLNGFAIAFLLLTILSAILIYIVDETNNVDLLTWFDDFSLIIAMALLAIASGIGIRIKQKGNASVSSKN